MKRILLPGLLAGFVVNIPDGIVSGAILQEPLAGSVPGALAGGWLYKEE